MGDNIGDNMGDGMGDAMGDNMGDGMGDDMGDNMGDGMGDDMGDNMGGGMGDNMGDAMGDGMGDDMGGNMGGDMGDNIGDNMGDGMEDGMGDGMGDTMGEGMGDGMDGGSGDGMGEYTDEATPRRKKPGRERPPFPPISDEDPFQAHADADGSYPAAYHHDVQDHVFDDNEEVAVPRRGQPDRGPSSWSGDDDSHEVPHHERRSGIFRILSAVEDKLSKRHSLDMKALNIVKMMINEFMGVKEGLDLPLPEKMDIPHLPTRPPVDMWVG